MTKKKKNSARPTPITPKIEQNLSKVILQFMNGKRYNPMTQQELIQRLNIPESLHPECKKTLTQLIEDEHILVIKKKLCLPGPQEETMTGILRMHPKGFGFVVPDHPGQHPQDIFIPKHLTDNAVDSDHVEVQINTEAQSDKGPEGKIIAVLSRARKHLAGTVLQIHPNQEITAYVPILGVAKPVRVKNTSDLSVKVGDRIIMKVVHWGSDKEQTVCEISHIIGHILDPSCDVLAAVEEFDVRFAFPKSAIDQAKAFGKKVPLKDLKKRVDLTKLECFTIDPDTAKDFDDALTLTKDKKGIYHLGVHIADVAHYVKPGTPLDKEAITRCNSTYFPGTCVPMLPEALSNELCSLKPDVVRLTVSVMMDFDKNGNMIKHEVVRSYIHSAKRFTYFETLDILNGKKKSPHAKTLKLMVDLCHLLKKKRYERGSIDFALPEMVILVDDQGAPSGLKKIEYDITHQLVEEFMLKANETVAKELYSRGKPVMYRVHDEPAEENFEDFFQFARSLGFHLPSKPTNADLQKMFQQAKNSPHTQQLSVAFIRSMKLAQYSSNNVGHYGLALEHYCHFTSPIRRYSDLVIQRLLFDEEPKDMDLDQIALKCSEQERVSFRAESSVKTLKKMRLLRHYLNENPYQEYPALVTRIKHFGIYFELEELGLEGFLHISELENDYFIYDQVRNLLVGKSTGKTHFIGEKIHVLITQVDLILQETKWMLATSTPRKGSSSKQSHQRKRRGK